LMGL